MTPPATKAVAIPGDPDDLLCDTCSNRYASRGDMLRTFESARVAGWHIHQEVMVRYERSTGRRDFDVKTNILCPTCVGTPRSKLPPPPPILEGQADILEDLGVQAIPQQKEKKPPKRGIN